MCEFNNIVPSDWSVTIPYRPDFSWQKLPAKLGKPFGIHEGFAAKGVSTGRMERTGVQRLLFAEDVAPDIFPTRAPHELDGNPFTIAMRKMHWQSIAHLPWVRNIAPDPPARINAV